MLNIGRLGGDLDAVVAYYAADICDADLSNAAGYYVGKESDGRWVGSLCSELGVDGAVDGMEFRRLLEGCHPISGEPLTAGARLGMSRRLLPAPVAGPWLSVNEAAERLNVGPRHVRKLLERGALDNSKEHSSYLVGERSSLGRGRWKVSSAEVNRFLNVRSKSPVRPGFDLTLRPPKSVSILWAFGTPEIAAVVADAHREAVDEVIAYYEQNAVYSRKRVKGEQMRISTGGLVGAAFDHRTSRAGDPLLHTHVVVFNAALCSDGQWRSIEAPTLYEHAKTGGYLYQLHLRHVLAKSLGVSWTPTVNGSAEIEGVPQQLIDHFSKRRVEIETAAALVGHSSAGAFQAAALGTRKAKKPGIEPAAEIERWRREALDFGVEFGDLIGRVSPAKTRSVDTGVEDRVEVPVDDFAELLSPNGLTKMTSTFAQRDVIRELAQRAGADVSARDVCAWAAEFTKSRDLLRLRGRGREDDRILMGDEIARESSISRYTTGELYEKESELLSWAAGAFDGEGPMVPYSTVAGFIDQEANLSNEQEVMVRSITRSGERLHLVSGNPGSGKTYAMRVAAEAFSLDRVPVVGAAVSAQAAAELEASIGLTTLQGRPATTIARLLADLELPKHGGFDWGTVLIVDEASMVGTRQLHQLVQHLDRAEGTLVLVGDPNQHGSVEAGGIYRHLLEQHKREVITLKANNRQLGETDRQAIEAFRDGKIDQAIKMYDATGSVVRSTTMKPQWTPWPRTGLQTGKQGVGHR